MDLAQNRTHILWEKCARWDPVRGSDSELTCWTGAQIEIQSNGTAYKQEKRAVSLPWDAELPVAAYYIFLRI